MVSIQEYLFSDKNIILLSNNLINILKMENNPHNNKYCRDKIISQIKILYNKYKTVLQQSNNKKLIVKFNQKVIDECVKQPKKIKFNLQEPQTDRIPSDAEKLERLVLERQSEYDNLNRDQRPIEPSFSSDYKVKENKNEDLFLDNLPQDLLTGLTNISNECHNFMELDNRDDDRDIGIILDKNQTKKDPSINQISEYELNLKLQQMQNERNYISSTSKQDNTPVKIQYVTIIDPLILLRMSSNDINDYLVNNFNIKPDTSLSNPNNNDMIKMLMELKEQNNNNKKILEEHLNNNISVSNRDIINKNEIVIIDVRDIVKDPVDYNDYLYEFKNKIKNINGIILVDCKFPSYIEKYYMYLVNINVNPCLEISENGEYKQLILEKISISELEEIIIQFKNKNGELVNFNGEHHILTLNLNTSG